MVGNFCFRPSRGRMSGELSAQGTQFLKPCGGVTHNCGDADHLAGIAGEGHDSELDRDPCAIQKYWESRGFGNVKLDSFSAPACRGKWS
jgi:hypothetical protein